MIDYSTVITSVATAVADVVAGGLIVAGGYAGFWGVRKVTGLFENEKSTSHPMPSYASDPDFSVNDHIKPNGFSRAATAFSSLLSGLVSKDRPERKEKKRKSRKGSGLAFSVSYGRFNFSVSPGTHGVSKQRKAYHEYSGGMISRRRSRHQGVSSQGHFGAGNSTYRDSYNAFASSGGGSFSSSERSFSPPPPDDRFAPPPLGDNFAPPPDERFGPY